MEQFVRQSVRLTRCDAQKSLPLIVGDAIMLPHSSEKEVIASMRRAANDQVRFA